MCGSSCSRTRLRSFPARHPGRPSTASPLRRARTYRPRRTPARDRGETEARRRPRWRQPRHRLERLARLRGEVRDGAAEVASDPYLALPSPSTFYELGIRASDPVLFGVTFPGLPSIVHGLNEHIAWGSTVNPTDVTDVFQESVIVSNGVPVATMFRGSQVPTQIFPQTYRANQPGNGTADDLVTVPPSASAAGRRRDRCTGPLIAPNLSVQWTGFSATREVDYFREPARAEDVVGAKQALRYFDVGAQNWMFADDSGNIAYYTDHELPLREDLQGRQRRRAAAVLSATAPAASGTSGSSPARGLESHAIPFAILPGGELDELVNPERGWISNFFVPRPDRADLRQRRAGEPGSVAGIRYVSPGHVDGNATPA